MKKFFAPILVALASLPLTSIAQSENPRDIYKMMTLTDSQESRERFHRHSTSTRFVHGEWLVQIRLK